MKVHVFGNSPSPAVVVNKAEFGTDVRQFINCNFYIDDGLVSLPSSDEAVDLLTRSRKMLAVQQIYTYTKLRQLQGGHTSIPRAGTNTRHTRPRPWHGSPSSSPVTRSIVGSGN